MMMAELEVDHTNLPRVQEVCQCFAVLEDGALAHNLQEQEIEQYYSTNIQKNQLVQNDIRVAKRLQDEEEEQWVQESALHRQASKQLEEQDFEYARLIQEEILRCAEEAQRREQDDEEMAKRIHNEEAQCLRRTSRGQDDPSEGSAATLPLRPTHRHTRSTPEQVEEQYSSPATRWQSSTFYGRSSAAETPLVGSCSPVAAPENRNSWSNEGHTDSFREFKSKFREPSSEDSEDSDAVFSEDPVVSKRTNDRFQTSPLRRQGSLHHPHERKYRSLNSHCTFPDELRVWEEEREGWEEERCENGGVEKRRPWIWHQERLQRKEHEEFHRLRDSGVESRLDEGRDRRCSRSESVRLHDRRRQSNRELARTWSCKDSADKHVRFQDESRRESREVQGGNSVWAMLGHVLRERGVPVRISNDGASLQILGPQRRDSQVLHGSEVSCSDSQPHQRSFQRASTTRHSFHGDIREKRRLSHRESSGRDHREDKERLHNFAEGGGEVYEISSRDSHLANREKGGSRRWRDSRYTNDHMRERNENDLIVSRTSDERRNRYNTVEEGLNPEEEAQRRRDQPGRRAPQRSQSLRSSSSSTSSRASTRRRSRHMAAEEGEASLDLGELQQVLQDEELARQMQEDEEKCLRRNSQSPPSACYPEGDFRVAQVAQDEEIAHFMQKQEMKSKRRSRELEGPSSWREHRAMISHHDRRAARDRQRERLDSEGLPSPTEDCCPENQPPSPTSTTLHSQHVRNIAEELDPTFQARRQSTERDREGETGLNGQTLPMQQHQFLEEPTFIPPTKRQTDKSGGSKPKEKKETCKQQ